VKAHEIPDLDPQPRDADGHGSAGDPVKMSYDDGLRQYQTDRPFEGVLPVLPELSEM